MARIPVLQNNCMKKFYETTERANYMPTDQLAYIWQHTNETSLLRKAMIDMLTWEWDTSVFLSQRDSIPNVVKDEALVAMRLCIKRILPLTTVRGPLENLTNYYVKVGDEST
ncbi:predicted protein [Sclerotinia sclerotiorum 1980 UF-70]|nr:predicted protein [Sclerotinia sclerotiorum 1980 UF-70]EDN99360.1 predicted protein [Sclerotinia sclerotiorum 1980 UF-70]